jgi:intracellular sulfur oxidation DsrE/DsrF family protein
MKYLSASLVIVYLFFHATLHAAEALFPWGSASEINQVYSRQKVVFDTTAATLAGLTSILDRASYMSQLNGADPFETKIVIMLHGDAIPFFTGKNFGRYKELMVRAQSLSVGDVIEFRMCRASALLQGFRPQDIHGFIKMVPMADAEIVRLQQEEGFAYMR